MTKLEEHDLKMANWKVDQGNKRIQLLFDLITARTESTQAIAIIREYRTKAKTI